MSLTIDIKDPQPNLVANFAHVFSQKLSSPKDIKLSDSEVAYIKYLLNDTAAFDNIENAIKEIMSDGKIDFHDLPQIVLLVSNIVHLNYSEIYKKIDKLAVIQYILDQIVDSGLLPLPAFELPIIRRIIDASIDLLKMNLNSNTRLKCWQKIWCCWG